MRFLRRTPPITPAVAVIGGRAIATLKPLVLRVERVVGRNGRRLRSFAVVGLQAGLAAALAWIVASQLFHNSDPVFAPAAAVSVIAASIGQHIRRTLRLIGGVLIGIAVGDLLIALVGSGPVQVGAVVAVAVTLAIALDGSNTLMSQAGSTAVLVVALHPTSPDIGIPRFINAAIGGAVGMTVYLVLFPLNPLRLIERRARPVIDLFATELATVAEALSTRDREGLEAALHRLWAADTDLVRARNALVSAREVVTLAPLRRHDRPVLIAYNTGFEFLERALRGCRGAVRRLADMLRDGERVPGPLPTAVRTLGEAATMLHEDLLAGRSTRRAETAALDAAAHAARGLTEDPGPNTVIAIAQIRTVAFDLLRAAGADRRTARRRIRETRPQSVLPH